jgi:hypothetical protein
MNWITYLKLIFWLNLAKHYENLLADIAKEFREYGELSCLYDDNDRENANDKLNEANAQIAKLVDGRELKFLGVLGTKRCEELLQKRLADMEAKIKSAPTLAEALHDLLVDASKTYGDTWAMDVAVVSEKIETALPGGPFKGLLYRIHGDDGEELVAVITCANPNTIDLRNREHLKEIRLMISELIDVPKKIISVNGDMVRDR